MWPSYQAETSNPVTDDWTAKMGAPTTIDYLRDNDQLLVGAGASYTAPTDSSEIETLRNQVKASIVQTSWQMVFAESDSQFDSLLSSLQETAKGLGYDKVLEVDMSKAEEQDAARKAVTAEFG
jgi:multiple sugar transport system substrate-binding protein/putative aldouronate transport system substrate-binding protein